MKHNAPVAIPIIREVTIFWEVAKMTGTIVVFFNVSNTIPMPVMMVVCMMFFPTLLPVSFIMHIMMNTGMFFNVMLTIMAVT